VVAFTHEPVHGPVNSPANGPGNGPGNGAVNVLVGAPVDVNGTGADTGTGAVSDDRSTG